MTSADLPESPCTKYGYIDEATHRHVIIGPKSCCFHVHTAHERRPFWMATSYKKAYVSNTFNNHPMVFMDD